MPRHAPELECSAEDKAALTAVTKSGTAEARTVDRARIVLACLEGKEIQQVARACTGTFICMALDLQSDTSAATDPSAEPIVLAIAASAGSGSVRRVFNSSSARNQSTSGVPIGVPRSCQRA